MNRKKIANVILFMEKAKLAKFSYAKQKIFHAFFFNFFHSKF